nr:transposase [Chitinophaga eiseniae]
MVSAGSQKLSKTCAGQRFCSFKGILSIKTVARTIRTHYLGILNFFNNRATNAAAEAFNAKIKSFRNALRGVRDIEFFLYRLTKLYA